MFLAALDAPELALTPGGDDEGTPDRVAHLPHGVVLLGSGEGRGSGLDGFGQPLAGPDGGGRRCLCSSVTEGVNTVDVLLWRIRETDRHDASGQATPQLGGELGRG